MATKIPVPKLGQSEETVTIESWRVKEGDQIKKGDVLFEVETDKAVLEVESQFEGYLLKIIIPAGKPVPVMSTAAIIGAKGEAIPTDIETPAAAPAPAPAASAAPAPAASAAAPAAAPAPATSGASAQKKSDFEPAVKSSVAAPPVVHKTQPSPRARKYAADYLVNLDKVPGTGGGVGRVTENDVKQYLDSTGYFSRKITPTALELAKKEKLDMTDLSGTGDSGRITLADVKDTIMEKPQEMSTMRKVIAQRLTQSKQNIPHFYVTVSVDMSTVMGTRKQLKEQGINLSVNVFVVKAVAKALKAFPMVNAETDGKVVRRKAKINVGVAVSIDNGLVVPVVRNADRKAMDEIHAEVAELADKARKGKLTPDEMKGGSFTISNMGMMNVESFGAIINPGEGGILAVASTVPTPVVRDGQIVIRDMMKISMSADHRIVDGSMAAEFVNAVKANLESADFWAQEL